VLESLPPSVADLRELRHLDLRENTLAELPEMLAGLPRLRQLDVTALDCGRRDEALRGQEPGGVRGRPRGREGQERRP
jgi:hypothetical protein